MDIAVVAVFEGIGSGRSGHGSVCNCGIVTSNDIGLQ